MVATDYLGRLICTERLPGQTLNIRGYRFRVEFERSFNFGAVLADLQSSASTYDPDTRHEAIQALNTALAHYPNVTPDIQSAGQSKHFQLTAGEHLLTGGLCALPGYFHSVRPSTNRLLLNVNFSAAPFYRGIPLTQLVTQFDSRRLHFRDSQFAARLQRFLRGLRITVTKPGEAPSEETISELVLRVPGGVAATPSDIPFPATDVTVAEHYSSSKFVHCR
jgi:hypothetical protein